MFRNPTPPYLEIFTPSFRESPPPLESRKFLNTPFLNFWLESQTPPFLKGGKCSLCKMYKSKKREEKFEYREPRERFS